MAAELIVTALMLTTPFPSVASTPEDVTWEKMLWKPPVVGVKVLTSLMAAEPLPPE